MELVCTVSLVMLAACAPATTPRQSPAGAQMQILRVSPSADLLGRQVAVAHPASLALADLRCETPNDGVPSTLVP